MLTPWKESYDQLRQHIKKQRHYFANKGPSSQSYGFFPVVMYGCESWTIKKAEHQRMDAFELWCWRRLLRVPWTARRSNQSILRKSVLNIHWKDWWWSWNSNTLDNWCKELTHGKVPNAGQDWKQEEKQMTKDEMFQWHHQVDGHEFEWAPGVGDGREALRAAVHGVTKSQTRLSDWTELIHNDLLNDLNLQGRTREKSGQVESKGHVWA